MIFALRPTGAKIPLNAKPVEAYKILETEHGPLAQSLGRIYTSHFSTCPDAARFSKGRGRKE